MSIPEEPDNEKPVKTKRRVSPAAAIAGTLLMASLAAWTLLGWPTGIHRRELVESRESLYNNIYIHKRGNYLKMSFGQNAKFYTETVYNTADELELPVTYTQFMTVSLIYPQKIGSILEIGSGGGRTAWYLHRFLPDVSITSVDLDPIVVELAHKHFGIRNEDNFRVISRDGRAFLMEIGDKYDIIMIDAYRGPFIPFHLLTQEFYRLVKEHLNEGGVVVQNIEPSTMLFDSAMKTFQAVFSNIDLYDADKNIVAVAYDGEKRGMDVLRRAASERQERYFLRYQLPDMLGKRRIMDSGDLDASATVLTDDFAPVETLQAIEKHNKQ